MDEQELLRQSKLGYPEAFNRLVEQYQTHVYNLALRMLADAGAAEDVTQDTFVSAYRNIKSFRAGNFRAWLMRIVANACRDYLRSARVRRTVSLDVLTQGLEFVPQSDAESPEALMLRRELSGALQVALNSLAVEQRMLLILVDLQGFSYEETARVLRVPIGTVKSRLSRGRLAIRDYLMNQPELLPADLRLRNRG